MKHVYLLLTVVGAAMPLSILIPWTLTWGPDLPRFFAEIGATELSRMFTYDLVIASLALFAMVVRAHQRGVRHAWTAIAATVGIGLCCGLPLLLWLRARHDEASASA